MPKSRNNQLEQQLRAANERIAGLEARGKELLEMERTFLDTQRLLRVERNFVSAILDTTGALVVVLDPQGRVIRFNRALEVLTGFSFPDIIGRFAWDFFQDQAKRDTVREIFLKTKVESMPTEFLNSMTPRNGHTIDVIWTNTVVRDEAGEPEFVIATGIDITELVQAQNERDRVINELKVALAKIKTLSGLIPICAGCKKIRDDQGYWHQVEEYIHDHSEAEFSHGLCPECIKRLYPEFYKQMVKDKDIEL